MRLHIRRIKMDDYPNRGDVNWVLFALLDQIDEQRANHEVA